MPRSRDHQQRARVAAYLARVRGVLPEIPNAPLARQRCADLATGRAANRWRHRGHSSSGWPSSPLRTPRRIARLLADYLGLESHQRRPVWRVSSRLRFLLVDGLDVTRSERATPQRLAFWLDSHHSAVRNDADDVFSRDRQSPSSLRTSGKPGASTDVAEPDTGGGPAGTPRTRR
jgi:hypothetical protein